MELKKAKATLAEMQKHFTGDWHDALETLGYYLHAASDITRPMDFGDSDFYDGAMMKDLHDAWPKKEARS